MRRPEATFRLASISRLELERVSERLELLGDRLQVFFRDGERKDDLSHFVAADRDLYEAFAIGAARAGCAIPINRRPVFVSPLYWMAFEAS